MSNLIKNSSAKEVKVCSFINPYLLLVKDVKNYDDNLDEINLKLVELVKEVKECKSKLPEIIPKGSIVLVSPFFETGVHWNKSKNFEYGGDSYCRGLITNYNDKSLKYSIYLLDIHHNLLLTKKSIVKVLNKKEFTIPNLVYPIGLNNILPAGINQQDQFLIEKNWSNDAIKLMQSLIELSTKCYFYHITTDESTDVKLGELNLLINDELLPMRKLLALSKCATPYPIKSNPKASDDSKDKVNDEGIINAAAADNDDDYEEDNDILIKSNTRCKHLNDIYEARFSSTIHKSLNKLGITNLRKIQQYIWPAISKNLNVVAIGPHNSGKTLGFIAPIASIINRIKDEQHKHYPLVLILTSSSNNVLYIQEVFQQLLMNYHSDIEVVGAFNGCNERNVIASICNKSKIFITTPAYLLRFFTKNKENKKLLNFYYIKHLVFDDIDKILINCNETLKLLISQYIVMNKNALDSNIQLIITSKTWSVTLKNFISKYAINPYICIRSFTDAAIYNGVKFRPRLISKEDKMLKVNKILYNHYQMVKTMIVCANDNESNELYKYLIEKNGQMDVIYIDSKTDGLKIPDIKSLWDFSLPGKYPLMICTDAVLSTLNINDVIWLIHYSLDVPTKTTFLLRFSTLMMNIKKNVTNIQVTIIIDHTNDIQLRGIVDLLERSGYIFSDELKVTFQKIYKQLDNKKQHYPVCNNIKLFGNCFKQTICPYRHSFLQNVDVKTLPFIEIGCFVKIQYEAIYYIHNTNHYSVRIDEYIDLNGQTKTVFKGNFAEILNKVFHYYSDKTKRLVSKNVYVGGIYAYDDILDQYKRVQVINVDKYDKNQKPLYVDLRAVDSGNVFQRVRVSKLLEMPEKLASEPSRMVDVILSNISPFDSENEWNSHAKECTFQWFKKQARDKNTYLKAKVCLNMGNTLWIDSLETCLMTDKHKLVNDSLKSHLINKEHAIVNNHHIANLQKLLTD